MTIFDVAAQFARTMYANELCRVCGQTISVEDARTAVFIGFDDDKKARSAHKECSLKKLPNEDWAYPDESRNQSAKV